MAQTVVRKAVFPVAGLGTRFLPATKAMPKEMLPVVDKPLIQYAVEEAAAAGITEMIFITGTLSRISRQEAEDLVRSLGGHASGSVSRRTAFVVAGEAAGSKLEKARALGVRVVDEAEFFRMIESNGSDSRT